MNLYIMNINPPEISIILPCLNEEQGLPFCLETINRIIQKHNLTAEIIVADNGSTDNSTHIARKYNARLITEKEQGYGAACRAGFNAAKGTYLFLADADGSYDFQEIPSFLNELRNGYDFVIGNRFAGKIEKDAMPFAHRHVGNPLLSWLLRLFFKGTIHDAHCGMRAISAESFHKLNLKTTGMEFASEMVIKIEKENLSIKELPINYHKRQGQSKLKSLADGWRHLRFMLLYSPLFLFFLPGIFLLLSGTILFYLNYFNLLTLGDVQFEYHPLFLFSLFISSGYQLIIFSLFSKTYAITHLGDKPIFEKLYKHITIENASVIGLVMCTLGAIIYGMLFSKWINTSFEGLNEIKNAILGLTLLTLGIQTIFSSFMLSILGIREK